MQTSISAEFKNTPIGDEADRILRTCVHCGFCNATCPTYQILGDELDGPRGRIYLIKQMMEGEQPDANMNLHLDRCLTCRSCETTCPSGVEYSKLLEIGRSVVSKKVKRGLKERFGRNLVAWMLRNSPVFSSSLFLGRIFRPLLPQVLKDKIPYSRPPSKQQWPKSSHQRVMIALAGCAQSALSPETNRATADVLHRVGISLREVKRAGCCGAVDLHTTTEDRAREVARNLIDTWWPEVENGVEGFVMTASGCGVTVKEYPHLFKNDSEYLKKATAISDMTWDLSELLEREIDDEFKTSQVRSKVAFHSPCTLQHGQQIKGKVESILVRVGYEVVSIPDSHLCCGSAGTYSLFQPELSQTLKSNKLKAIKSVKADIVCTANIGCQSHLTVPGKTEVKHWVELLL